VIAGERLGQLASARACDMSLISQGFGGTTEIMKEIIGRSLGL